MKTPNKKKKEEDILNGCFKLFLDKKQDITLAALEEVTGVTRGRIYYYFKDLTDCSGWPLITILKKW